MKTQILRLLLVLGVLAEAGLAQAEPLSNAQLGVFQAYLECRNRCENGKVALVQQCSAGCAATADAAGAARGDWDKNKDTKVDEQDYELSVLEAQDERRGTLICYENSAVVPKNACGLADCLATRTTNTCNAQCAALECADNDKDGLRQYQEALLGKSDSVEDKKCGVSAECGGFDNECRWIADANARLCMPRVCEGTCTAFHLESIVKDNNEVLVRVHYDWSPTPATTLDLRINYSRADLTLVDARPTKALAERGKQLSTKQNDAGFMRLVVIGPGNTLPIPFGPIAELLFTRTSAIGSALSFSTNDAAQSQSMAPNPAEHRDALKNDARWGQPVLVPGAADNADRTMLYYSFDNPSQPLDYNEARPKNPDGSYADGGETLCGRVAGCRSLAQGSTGRAQRVARYNPLQDGVVDGSRYVEGVSGTGLFFDGLGNHLELPITLNAPAANASYLPEKQNFSLSTWFYNEGDGLAAAAGQVLFSHNTQSSERTRFGLMVVPVEGASQFNLVFFQGDVMSPELNKTTVKSGLANRTWTHAGLTVDAAARKAQVYVNGVAAGAPIDLVSTPVMACPELEGQGGTGIVLHDFGQDVADAGPLEALFYASAQNNLFGIEQTDPNGLSKRTISRLGDSTALDADYSPAIEKVVFASSRTGNYEIWISNPDGSNPQQVTSKFGDTARGIFARRPKWAPDGSAIVFESNAYSPIYRDNSTNPPTLGDNMRIRAYHLYYVAYDAIARQVAVPSGTSTVAQLDYDTLVQQQTIPNFRLTGRDQANHHYRASWLQGTHELGGASYLGEIVFTNADDTYRNATVGSLRIPSTINRSTPTSLSPLFSDPQNGGDVRVLTARRDRRRGEQAPTTLMLLAREWRSFDGPPENTVPYKLEFKTEADGIITYDLTFQPSGFAATCWDKNANRVCDSSENRNHDLDGSGNNKCDVSDCYPSSIRDLYVRYAHGIVAPRRYTDADSVKKELVGQLVSLPGDALATNQKVLELGESPTEDGAFLKVDVASNLNDTPLAAGTLLAKLQFKRVAPGDTGVRPTRRSLHQKLYVWDGAGTPAQFEVATTDLEEVFDARFAPSMDRLVMSGLQNARPVVVRTKDLEGTLGMYKISVASTRVEGLDWERLTRVYPCNWVGVYRNPAKGTYNLGFRGALDELKIYSYVRPLDAFAAEAERGFERLRKEGRLGSQDPANGPCSNSFECPAYQICECPEGQAQCPAKQCVTHGCKPGDAYPCEVGSTCTLLPVPLDSGREEPRWVCSVECATDSQCFEQECANGPCRFCGAGSACMECREEPRDLGGITVSYVEGCPDRNGFACEQGSCQSECYSMENGQSQYLCDEALEYCRQGRCVLNKWDWPDFAPATFVGLGEMVVEDIDPTIALSQLYPVSIEAYGMEDYEHDPEVLVQGVSDALGDGWFDIGRITVRNKTSTEAELNKYLLYTPYQISQIRFQLINPPYANIAGGATGLTTRDDSFCASEEWSDAQRSLCFRRTPSSGAQLGYPSNLTALERIQACQGRPECPSLGEEEALRKYLQPGQQTVILKSVFVGVQELVFGENTICSYENTAEPIDPSGRVRRLVFGDLHGDKSESSNRAAGTRAANPGVNWSMLDLRAGDVSSVIDNKHALLNCAYAEFGVGSPRTAQAVAEVTPGAFARPESDTVTENANGCFVKLGNTQEPCFEWAGGEVSLDPFNAQLEPYKTLDFDLFRSFGYEACTPVPGSPNVMDCSDTRALRN